MIVFDSDAFAPADRIDAYHAFAHSHMSPCEFTHEGTGPSVRLRQEVVQYGPVTGLRTRGTGFRMVRDPHHIRRTTRNAVSVVTQQWGAAAEYAWKDHAELVTGATLSLTDRTESHTYGWTGVGGAQALVTDAETLALPEHVVRAAIPRVTASPLVPFLLHQTRLMCDGRADLATGPAGRSLGHAAVDLIRALVMSVTEDGPLRRAVADQTLLARILAYADLHSADPALTPQRVAAAHHISLRTLYRLCGDAGISLEQEIIGHRLRAARRALENPANRHRTITAIALAHGFTDPAFFTRRFRRAHGRTPTEWRRLTTGEKP